MSHGIYCGILILFTHELMFKTASKHDATQRSTHMLKTKHTGQEWQETIDGMV